MVIAVAEQWCKIAMWRMQEGRTLSPLAEIGPVSCLTGSVGEDANLRALVPHQERRRVLLHVRTADPFVGFHEHHHLRQQTASATPSPSPISEGASAMESEEPEEAMQICNINQSQLQQREQGKEGHEENAVVDRAILGDNEEGDEEGDDEDEENDSNNHRDKENGISRRRIGHRGRRDDEEDDEEIDDDENISVNISNHDESRNGNYPDEEDVEVDVCREDIDESNPSSPVDLTAASRCSGNEQFLHPFVGNRSLHSLSCIPGSVVDAGVANCMHSPIGTTNSTYLSGVSLGHLHPGNASDNVVTSACGNNVGNNAQGRSNNTSNNIKTTTTTAGSVQTNKRGLAFSVENILDPNKFTGGRIIHDRISHRRRRRTGSVHEGKFFKFV